jgi:hypothetical protein
MLASGYRFLLLKLPNPNLNARHGLPASWFKCTRELPS